MRGRGFEQDAVLDVPVCVDRAACAELIEDRLELQRITRLALIAKLVRPLLIVVSLALTIHLIYGDPSNIIHRVIVQLVR